MAQLMDWYVSDDTSRQLWWELVVRDSEGRDQVLSLLHSYGYLKTSSHGMKCSAVVGNRNHVFGSRAQ